MSRTKACVVLASLLAVMGCAGTPEVTGEPPAAAAEDSNAAAPVTITVVDAHELIAREPPRVFCRDMLQPNSNVHVKQCMTAEDWKRYERLEAREALGIVRMMQGSDR